MVSLQLKPKQPEKYNGKRDFQVIDNWITSVDSYFALTHAEAPDIYHYLNTILTGEAAAWFRFIYRNVDPNTSHLGSRQNVYQGVLCTPQLHSPITGRMGIPSANNHRLRLLRPTNATCNPTRRSRRRTPCR